MSFGIVMYEEKKINEWDEFVLNKSMNGTFLQTRKFINYHGTGKFKDCSLMVLKGQELVAVVLACECIVENKKTFVSHRGTSFGGIIISRQVYNSNDMDDIVDDIEQKIYECGFEKIYLKITPELFQKDKTDLLDYILYKKNYMQYTELNFYMDLSLYQTDILSRFSKNKRRDYRYSLKHNLQCKELTTKEEIHNYYLILQKNLKKLNLPSVHSYEDLLDIKYNRFNSNVLFYGVYKEERMIAGSMIFIFENKSFHTQYLSSDEEYLKCYPMDFLIYNLIKIALDKNMHKFTFGICTENEGKYLNKGLARFKEGFGAEYSLNKGFYK